MRTLIIDEVENGFIVSEHVNPAINEWKHVFESAEGLANFVKEFAESKNEKRKNNDD